MSPAPAAYAMSPASAARVILSEVLVKFTKCLPTQHCKHESNLEKQGGVS
jgi:hypothetical protein